MLLRLATLYINSKLSRFVFQVALSLLLAFEKPLISTFQFEKICVKNAVVAGDSSRKHNTNTSVRTGMRYTAAAKVQRM